MKVLVADDDRKVREYVTALLERAGYETVAVKTGLEAIRVAQDQRPEIILADGLMPEMHGFEVSRFIRQMAVDYRPTIIVMTAIYKDRHYQSEARLRYGVDRYLVKPASDEMILEVVNQAALEQKTASDQAGEK